MLKAGAWLRSGSMTVVVERAGGSRGAGLDLYVLEQCILKMPRK